MALSGGTLALWNQPTAPPGAETASGNLDIKMVGRPLWIDQTTERTDSGLGGGKWARELLNESMAKDGASQSCFPTAVDQPSLNLSHLPVGHPIDLDYDGGANPWYATPNDEVAVVYPYSVALEGDNMVGEIRLTVADAFDYPELTLGVSDGLVGANNSARRGNIFIYAWLNGKPVMVDQHPTNGANISVTYLQAVNENYGTMDPDYPDPDTFMRVTNQRATSNEANLCIVVTNIKVANLSNQNYALAGGPAPPGAGKYKTLFGLPEGAISIGLYQRRTSGYGNFK
jgi:hypothetical protein